jgi:aspartate racemase
MASRESAVGGLLPPLDQWAGSRTVYPRDQTVAALFEQAAAKYPDREALIFGHSRLTYQELNGRANALARKLQGIGAGPEKMVGLCAERSLEMIVGMLATLKAGAAFVPFDPAYPRERLRLMASDANVQVMLTQKALLDTAAGSGQIATVILEEQGCPTVAERQNLESLATATNLAYVMFTSGSTGRPKGVLVENRSIVRLVFNTNFCQFGPREVFLQYAPISFDASTLEIWGALLHGAKLVLMPPEASSLEDLGKAIRAHGVSTMWLTAGLFHLFVDQRVEDLLPVRQLLAGGDTLSPSHVRRALDRLPNTIIINGYGPTEGTTFTCCHAMRHGDSIGASVSIGRPISNSFSYVLDENLEPVAAGEVGELYAGGDGIARGYLNAPEMTRERFLRDPFSKMSDARMYRTGDLARWLPDGTLEFLGRRDHQVKILGHRIELGEIEATLTRHPAIQQACVAVSSDGASNKRLVAYYVSGKNGSAGPAEVKDFLARQLPAFMVPAFFVSLHSFPLSPNGKVDRAALPDPASPEASVRVETRGSELEEQIAALWRQVLGTERVGLDDNFFDLGGDSLLIVAIHSQLQKMLQREIQVTDLFEHVTVRSLARHVSAVTPVAPSFSAAQEQARKQREALAKGRLLRGNS